MTRLLLVLIALSTVTLCQTPTVAERLQSDVASERAWGAYDAAQTERELAPEVQARLRTLLVDPGPFPKDQRTAIRRAVIDAMVLCNVSLPADALQQAANRFRAASVVLASRDADRHVDSLRTLWKPMTQDGVWLATGSLLVGQRAPGVAAQLLAGLDIELHVTVLDDRRLGGGRGGSYSTARGCGGISAIKDFPPIAHWTLHTSKRRNGIQVTEGRHPVWATRRVSRKTMGIGSVSRRSGRPKIRREWIMELLQTDEEGLALKLRYSRNIRWTNAQAFKAAARLHRTSVEQAFLDVARRLHAKKLLTDAERAAAQPRVAVHVIDGRVDKSKPLPELASTKKG